MSELYILKEYYARYLKNIRGVKDSSVNHYIDALNFISRLLIQRDRINRSIFEIYDISELETLRNYLKNDIDFISFDKRGHQMYSAGLNNYIKFATGEGFTNLHEDSRIFDVEIPVKDIVTTETSLWKRSNIIKTQAIEIAGYLCEIDASHHTFTAESTRNQYMEGHHAIPMRAQKMFNASLDVYANVVCLCPICHRLLHYGINEEKKILIDQIYYKRADRLANSGLRLSREDFEMIAL